MAFYLSPFIGTGASDDPFRPDLADGVEYSIIDLRGDATQQAGWCWLWVHVPDPLNPPTPPPGSVVFNLDLDDPLSAGQIAGINAQLGVTLTAPITFREAITELLILHGSFVDPTKWNPLQQRKHGFHAIVLGPHLVYNAPSIQGAVITESFDQADSSTLGPDLTWTEVLDDWETTTNRANVVTPDGSASARAESDLDGVDHYAEAVMTSNGGTNDATRGGCAVRFSSSADTWYAFVGRFSGVTAAKQIYKSVAGTTTSLASANGTFTNGDVIRTEADGSLISGFVDGSLALAVTDTSITAGTRTGLASTTGGDHDHTWDDFTAADLTDPRIFLVGLPQSSSAADGADITLTFDTDAPPAEGDTVYLVGGNGGDGSAAGPITSGYTEIFQHETFHGARDFGVWRKRMGATPDTTVQGEGGGNAADGVHYSCLVLRGVDETTPEDVAVTSVTGIDDIDPAAITPVTDDCLILVATGNGNNQSITAGPSGYFNVTGGGGPGEVNEFTAGFATKNLGVAATENPGAWDWNTGGRGSVCVTIAVRPAGAGGGPGGDVIILTNRRRRSLIG